MNGIFFSKEISVIKKVDVIVLGGGPAGIAASIASARSGAKTMLIEKYGVLGGSATVSLVGPFMTSFSNDGSIQLCKGIFEELVNGMVKIDGAIHPKDIRYNSPYCGYRIFGHDHVTPFELEAMKKVSMDMVNEAGVHTLLHTSFVDVIMKGNMIDKIITFNKTGMQAYKAKVYIDCTGDADVAASSRVPIKVGREEDGLTQPMTMFFRMANIDDKAVDEYRKLHPEEGERLFGTIVDEKRESGEWTIARDKVAMYKTTIPGIWRFNITRILGLDGTKAEDLTKAEIEGREQVHQLVEFFHKHLPGFENAVLIDTAVHVGIRETRRIVGEYVLSVKDLVKPTKFKDVIGLSGYPVDIHDPKGMHGGCSDEYNTADVYQIPYRSLIPLKVDNLLVAGRCVSATFEALGAIRVIPSCMVMGQAAGTAAALAVVDNMLPRRVNVKNLQQKLLDQNVYLGEI